MVTVGMEPTGDVYKGVKGMSTNKIFRISSTREKGWLRVDSLILCPDGKSVSKCNDIRMSSKAFAKKIKTGEWVQADPKLWQEVEKYKPAEGTKPYNKGVRDLPSFAHKIEVHPGYRLVDGSGSVWTVERHPKRCSKMRDVYKDGTLHGTYTMKETYEMMSGMQTAEKQHTIPEEDAPEALFSPATGEFYIRGRTSVLCIRGLTDEPLDLRVRAADGIPEGLAPTDIRWVRARLRERLLEME